MRQGTIAAAALVAVLAGPAAGQVHKCVGPDGAVSYTSEPCEGGEAKPLESISITPGMPEEQRQQMDEASRARQQADRERRQQRIAETSGEVRRIQRENADPEKCQRARDHLERMRAMDWPTHVYKVNSVEHRQAEQLYCYP